MEDKEYTDLLQTAQKHFGNFRSGTIYYFYKPGATGTLK